MGEGKRILVVDDEPANLDLLDALLKTFGYDSECTRSGAEALEKLSPLVDLVLLDVMMPSMDGFEVTRRIRADPLCFDVPIIMVTGLTDKADRLRATEAGANDFISKPIDRIELRVRMQSLLRMKEAQDAIKKHRAELEDEVERRTKVLRQTEQRYRTLFEDSLDPIVIVFLDGQIIDANRAFLELFEFSRDEILGMKVSSLYADTSDRRRFVEELLRIGSVKDYGWRARTRSGALKDCVLTTTVRRGPDGEVLGYQSIIRDVTERKRAKAALMQSEARNRLLIEASPVGVMMVQDGFFTQVNPAFVHMFGYNTAAEILARPIEALCAAEDVPALSIKAQRALQQTDTVYWLEMRGLTKDGRHLDISVWLRSIDLEGKPSLLGFVVDLTEHKALRGQLLQAQKMQALGTLAGGIAHDFNNILFAISGFTELVLEDLPEDSPAYDNLEQVLRASSRAGDLVRQILTFSRQSDEERHPIQIGPIVKETMKFLRASVPSTIEIQLSLTEPLGTIMAHPTQIHQILMNLCTNAAQAMREGGGILSVVIEQVEQLAPDLGEELPTGPCLKLTVADTGHGIPPEFQDRIFEPYFTTKNPGEGTGLGLAVVHGIVETNGGVIEMESEPGGTTFRVYFPVIEDEPEAVHEAPAVVPTGNEHVLLVDDDDAVVRAGSQMLESLGYRVVGVPSAVEALDLIRGQPDLFDVVITDMTMPRMTGTELAAALQRLRPQIPVVLCTGYSEKLTRDSVDQMGISAFMTKPVAKSALAQTVRRVLDRALR